MGIFKRLAGIIGLGAKDDDQIQRSCNHDENFNNMDNDHASTSAAEAMFASAVPSQKRKGFSVPVQVQAERGPPAPLLVLCQTGDGGVQGLRWYARRLRIDEDGDVADEFLEEISIETSASMEEDDKPLPKFQVKYSTRPAKVKNQALLPNGKIHHLVEYQGRLEWV